MSSTPNSFIERLPLLRGRPLLGYIAVFAISAIGLAVRFPLMGTLVGYPFLTFFPAVILSSFLFGFGPGLFAAIICGFAAWYVFIPPFYTFHVDASTVWAMSFYAVVVAVDIFLISKLQASVKRQIAERERANLLAERTEILFRELQHRISNNLQMVGGLLTLQRRDVSDPAARAALDEAARRLGLIGRIHRQLHDPKGEQIRFGLFLRELVDGLIDSGGKPGIALTLETDDDIALPPDAAIPIAIIVAEAVANALEHGFPDRDQGSIEITAKRHDRELRVMVADDGLGLPEGFDLSASRSLGLRLAQMLAKQLGGGFTLSRDGRTVARLILPA
jgi:two-component sensor histidine kinase